MGSYMTGRINNVTYKAIAKKAVSKVGRACRTPSYF